MTMYFLPVIEMITEDMRHCGWAVKQVQAAQWTQWQWGVKIAATDAAACYFIALPGAGPNKADAILFRQPLGSGTWCEVHAVSFLATGNKGPIFIFYDAHSSQDVQDALDVYFRTGHSFRCVKEESKTWTLREAYEANKTLQKCCVCGKPTETRSLCTSNVQYCRCIESLKS